MRCRARREGEQTSTRFRGSSQAVRLARGEQPPGMHPNRTSGQPARPGAVRHRVWRVTEEEAQYGAPQFSTQKVLYFLSAPIEPGARTTTFTW